jgi:hypothetical protein
MTIKRGIGKPRFSKLGFSALALLLGISLAPMMAGAALPDDLAAALTSAVDSAMVAGNTEPLQQLLTTDTLKDTNQAADLMTLVANEVMKDAAVNPGATVAGSTTTIAEAVVTASVTAIVAAAPGQAGAVLAAAQTSLSPDLQVAAVTATQSALAPAAGGATANATGVNPNASPLPTTTSQTAEVPRQSTASPAS